MKQHGRKQWMALWLVGGALMTAGGCLAPNYYSTLFGDTIIPGVASALLESILTAAGM